MNSNKSKHYIGTVGFSYESWGNAVFFPSNLPRSEWLPYYARHFNAVEISHTFSKVPDKETFTQWYAQSPAEFRFALKGNQYITHVKKLKGVGEPLKLFMDPALKLKEKLAAIVWEIPKLGREQNKNLEAFLKHLKKYPGIQYFFHFEKDASPDQKTFQLIQENSCELISLLPQDALIENKHYFRISLESPQKAQEWENDLLKKIKTTPQETFFVFFDDPQQASSIKQAQNFLNKINS